MDRRGRRVRRAAGGLALALLLALVLGLSILTRLPEARIVERAQEWPLVGPAAQAFRERYVGSTRTESGTGEAADPQVVIIQREAREQVWVAEGTVLRAEPSEDAEALGTIPAMSNVSLLERRGRWAWVDYRGAVGWVVPMSVAGKPALGSRPSPVLPVSARAPDPEVLERGLRSFSRTPTEHAFGEYRIFVDTTDFELVDHCRRVEARLLNTYQQTFDLKPVGEAAEAILLYPSRIPFETFWQLTAGAPVPAVGRTERGIVATFVGDRSAEEVCATLIHELTHLLNRRAVGPALPPWLEEGMATEVAARLAGGQLDTGVVRLAAHRGTLPQLGRFLELDREAFHIASLRRLHYELSGLWVRFLLEDPELAEGLRAFLRYLAQGGPYSPGLDDALLVVERQTPMLADDLAAFLGLEIDELETRFRSWIDGRQAVRSTGPSAYVDALRGSSSRQVAPPSA